MPGAIATHRRGCPAYFLIVSPYEVPIGAGPPAEAALHLATLLDASGIARNGLTSSKSGRRFISDCSAATTFGQAVQLLTPADCGTPLVSRAQPCINSFDSPACALAGYVPAELPKSGLVC